jgi:hypothetical protein
MPQGMLKKGEEEPSIYAKGAPLVMDGCVARYDRAAIRGHFLATENDAWATLELTNMTISKPKDGMGGKYLIDLGTGSETNSAYTSITLVGCSVEQGDDAKSNNTIKAGTGAVAIYRKNNLTTNLADQRDNVTSCDATASFRWVHAARLLLFANARQANIALKRRHAQTWRAHPRSHCCPAGYYQLAVDAKKCTACAVGRYSAASSNTGCIPFAEPVCTAQ